MCGTVAVQLIKFDPYQGKFRSAKYFAFRSMLFTKINFGQSIQKLREFAAALLAANKKLSKSKIKCVITKNNLRLMVQPHNNSQGQRVSKSLPDMYFVGFIAPISSIIVSLTLSLFRKKIKAKKNQPILNKPIQNKSTIQQKSH